MHTLFLIPARGGSKGIPDKNIKILNGKPLIFYSIDLARKFSNDRFICVSTDSGQIRSVAEGYGLAVPFLRPSELATDAAGSYEVIMHALEWYEKQEQFIPDRLVLLQPTSPLRLEAHVRDALALYSETCDMVVSVKLVSSNLFATCYKDQGSEYLRKAFDSGDAGQRRQDSDPIYQLNGAIYVMNVESLKKGPPSGFSKIRKLMMDEEFSVDIDTPYDWEWCQFLMQKQKSK